MTEIFSGDSLEAYPTWEQPDLILSDGPYGLGIFPGEPKNPELLAEWYEPHVRAWSEASKPSTTLWLWNSEVGWANIHHLMIQNGWKYKETTVWNKGIGHIAGKVNSKTIRGLPVVTEIAVRYVRKPVVNIDGIDTALKEWLRAEWKRSGLPLNQANVACGVKNVATRKYLTQDEMWYWPPVDAIVKMAEYCNKYGKQDGKPYFDLLIKQDEWDKSKNIWNNEVKVNTRRAKWNHKHGLTNVWDYPALRSSERIKNGNLSFHANQKPLELIERQIELSTDENDVVWEPFGGTGTVSVASQKLNRKYCVAEVNKEYFDIIKKRLTL